MKVYILIRCEAYESYHKIRVFDSYEKARENGPKFLHAKEPSDFFVAGPFCDNRYLGEWGDSETFGELCKM